MIQHIWTIPCRLSVVDRDSNNVSLIEVVEEIAIPAAGMRLPDNMRMLSAFFDVVTVWGREHPDAPEEGFGRLTLVSPTGEATVEQEYHVDLAHHPRARTIGRIIGFPRMNPGRCHLRVDRRDSPDHEWEQVASVPIALVGLPVEINQDGDNALGPNGNATLAE